MTKKKGRKQGGSYSERVHDEAVLSLADTFRLREWDVRLFERYEHGEIDLIAEKDDRIYYVEYKTHYTQKAKQKGRDQLLRIKEYYADPKKKSKYLLVFGDK